MPIRFRCAYCDQLLAIAQRKANTVVRCPKCAGQVIVPNPEPGVPAGASQQRQPGGNIFEQSGFGLEFQPIPPAPPAPPQTHGETSPTPRSGPPAALPTGLQGEFDVEPVMLPGTGLFFTPGKLALAGVIIVLLMGLAFFAGFLVGKG